MQIEKHL